MCYIHAPWLSTCCYAIPKICYDFSTMAQQLLNVFQVRSKGVHALMFSSDRRPLIWRYLRASQGMRFHVAGSLASWRSILHAKTCVRSGYSECGKNDEQLALSVLGKGAPAYPMTPKLKFCRHVESCLFFAVCMPSLGFDCPLNPKP